MVKSISRRWGEEGRERRARRSGREAALILESKAGKQGHRREIDP